MTTGLKRVTPREHILLRPDMYIGSIGSETSKEWVVEKDNKLVYKEIKFVPGLYKIFDEIITNSSDNKQRDENRNRNAQMKYIKVNFEKSPTNEKKVYIIVENDGIEGFLSYNTEEKMYNPELAFGHLMTSTNYDDTEERVTGGRNGFGAKLTNIYSKEFTVEVVEGGQKYVQTWKENMSVQEDYEITKVSDKKLNYIKIKFLPDYAKFHLDTLDEFNEALLRRRVFDVAGCNTNINVTLNGKVLPIHNFRQYVQHLFCAASPEKLAQHEIEEKLLENTTEVTAGTTNTTITKKQSSKHWTDKYIAYFEPTDRWSIAVFASEKKEFQQISFVNSIYTMQGGNHVELMLDLMLPMINECVKQYLRKNDVKNAKDLTRAQMKQNLFIVIRSLVVNPSFDSQTKIFLKTSKAQMKSAIQEKDFEKQWKAFQKDVGNLENLMAMYAAMINTTMQKVLAKTDGAKSRTLNIEKLEDAVYAGTDKSARCALYLTEGDSAKTTVVEGIDKLKDGRKFNGIFPLRGKVLNVRDCPADKVKENKEITNIKKILGLRQEVDYSQPENRKQLRYGKVVIMTDQDTDGSHIKGLLLNMFDTYWPSLLRSGYVQQFITPIIKVTPQKGKKDAVPINFYTVPEYDEWLSQCDNPKQYTTAYYKGLGTSSKAEVREYFKQIDTHKKEFEFDNQASTHLNIAFNKKMANNRKDWLNGKSELDIYLDTKPKKITISDFVNKELVLYELDAIKRAIPSMIDGLKPSQRKIIYGCFKRKLTTKIKVAQLSGYVAEHSAYHHGEGSLATTIVGLAQSFTGANNISYLVPCGQFGSRPNGGKDSAAPRYIFTYLQPILKYIYIKEDEDILLEQQEDNQIIEPRFYVPILPMILINGANGIGTGWSTTVPQFNPIDIVNGIRRRLYDRETRSERYGPKQLTPWYCGWDGDVEPVYYDVDNQKIDKWIFKGVAEANEYDKTITITELPPLMWTNDFISEVRNAIDKTPKPSKGQTAPSEQQAGKLSRLQITDIENEGNNEKVKLKIVLDKKSTFLDGKSNEKIIQELGLQTTIRVNNMMLHDEENKLKRYASPSIILDEFFEVRLKFYEARLKDLINKLTDETLLAMECARFIKLVNSGEIKIQNVPLATLCESLWTKQFMPRQMDRLKMLKGQQLDAVGAASLDEASEGHGDRADIRENEKLLKKTVTDVTDATEFFKRVKKPQPQQLQKIYQYLTRLALYNLTTERMKKLHDEAADFQARLQKLKQTKPKDLWEYELAAFEIAYEQYAAQDKINKEAGSGDDDDKKLAECAHINVQEKDVLKRVEEVKAAMMKLPERSADDQVEPQLTAKSKAVKEVKPKAEKLEKVEKVKKESKPRQTKVKEENEETRTQKAKGDEKKVKNETKKTETQNAQPKKPGILAGRTTVGPTQQKAAPKVPKNKTSKEESTEEDYDSIEENFLTDGSGTESENDDYDESEDDI